ncbi:MAG: acyl-ACP thioesterase [Melioribacteraceae bacterium]|nr:MAG: acyl-ACP thioesterase [Melioribacteraceae bacterium]
MAYERKYFIHNYDCDISGRLSISSMIKYFEDIALLHSEDVGFGMQYYLTEHVAWILHQWNIEIFDKPFFMDNIKLVTNPYSYKAFMANREFEIYSEDDDLLVKADSVWLFTDSKLRKTKRIDADVMKAYGIGENGPELFTKLPDPKPALNFEDSYEYVVRKSDIDINNHLNNVRYIDLAIEALPEDITDEMELGNIDVIFKKELLLEDLVTIGYKKLNEEAPLTYIHSVLNSKREVCAVIKTEWI